MIQFLKAQLSSLIATAIDFFVTVALIEMVRLSYLTSSLIGAMAGAITNFTINKYWSFGQRENELKTQGIKYSIVWLGSISLNVILSNSLIKLLGIPYLISKIIVSVIVGITFNYQLQKHYVFRKNN